MKMSYKCFCGRNVVREVDPETARVIVCECGRRRSVDFQEKLQTEAWLDDEKKDDDGQKPT